MNKPHSDQIIVFISGSFLNTSYWDLWKTYFEQEGYSVYVPEFARLLPSTSITYSKNRKSIDLKYLLDESINFIKRLPDKPILIGHSLGGLLVQLLLQQDLVKAGVALHSFSPRGEVILKYAFFTSFWKFLSLFKANKTIGFISQKAWQSEITNGMPVEEQLATYNKYAVPEPCTILRDTLRKIASVDFKKHIAPLLIIAGSKDKIIRPSINYANFLKYKHFNAEVFYKEFEDENHFVMSSLQWEKTASYILQWMLLLEL